MHQRSFILVLVSGIGFALSWSSSTHSRNRPMPLQTKTVGKRILQVQTKQGNDGRCLQRMHSSHDSNVVLRPSSDPHAFDSLKVGMARVHRYAKSVSETEYVMWYHGRSVEMDSESQSLPPLSTGRIGRATSRNGLHWERSVEGSLSEDTTGVSLGLNKESWWSFDTTHVGLGQVLLPMSNPAVITDGGVYLMYYMGGGYDESKASHYLESASPETDAVKMKGMAMKIGVALSQDGISFGRVEGEDPSGAIMAPYCASDVNMQWMTNMKDENEKRVVLEEELYCAWPEVGLTGSTETEMDVGIKKKKFYMYYSTMLKGCKSKAIALAVSDDGFQWFKRGVCLRPSLDSLDNGGCARCNIVRKFDAETQMFTGGWLMFYEGVSKLDGKHRILVAESEDGYNWQKYGVALDVGDSNAWDCGGVGSPHIIRLDDGSCRMYYTGTGPRGSTAIGVAKGNLSTVDKWVREQAQFSFLSS